MGRLKNSKFKKQAGSKALLIQLCWDDEYSEIPAAYIEFREELITKLLKAHRLFLDLQKKNPDIDALQIRDCSPTPVMEADYENSDIDLYNSEYCEVTPLSDIEIENLTDPAYKIDFHRITIDQYGFYWSGYPHHSSGHFTTSCISWKVLSEQVTL